MIKKSPSEAKEWIKRWLVNQLFTLISNTYIKREITRSVSWVEPAITGPEKEEGESKKESGWDQGLVRTKPPPASTGYCFRFYDL